MEDRSHDMVAVFGEELSGQERQAVAHDEGKHGAMLVLAQDQVVLPVAEAAAFCDFGRLVVEGDPVRDAPARRLALFYLIERVLQEGAALVTEAQATETAVAFYRNQVIEAACS